MEVAADLWLAEAAALLALAGLTAYALLGITDFGGGVWDLLARGPRASAQRLAIARAMGPVWEANHVWLIFVIVILFTAFPPAFAALSVALFAPFHLVLVGIVLRGAAFVFRGHGADVAGPQRAWASLFGAASVVTPFLLGTALAAISSGAIRVSGEVVQAHPSAWLGPFALAVGALTLSLGAYLAAVYLTVETSGALQEDFRRRALAAGAVVAVLAAVTLPLTAAHAPWLWSRLARPQTAPVLWAGLALALLSAWAVRERRYRLARVAAALEVTAVLWGWALAQWPYLIYPDVTVEAAAASPTVLRFVLLTLPVGGSLLAASLGLLFAVFKGANPAAPAVPTAPPASPPAANREPATPEPH